MNNTKREVFEFSFSQSPLTRPNATAGDQPDLQTDPVNDTALNTSHFITLKCCANTNQSSRCSCNICLSSERLSNQVTPEMQDQEVLTFTATAPISKPRRREQCKDVRFLLIEVRISKVNLISGEG